MSGDISHEDDDGFHWNVPWPPGTRVHQAQWYDPRRGITPRPAIEVRLYQSPETNPDELIYQLRRLFVELAQTIQAGDMSDRDSNTEA